MNCSSSNYDVTDTVAVISNAKINVGGDRSFESILSTALCKYMNFNAAAQTFPT